MVIKTAKTANIRKMIVNCINYISAHPHRLETKPWSWAQGQVLALGAHCVHIAHAEVGILTQEYLSPI